MALFSDQKRQWGRRTNRQFDLRPREAICWRDFKITNGQQDSIAGVSTRCTILTRSTNEGEYMPQLRAAVPENRAKNPISIGLEACQKMDLKCHNLFYSIYL
jgi:hypothetical protein